MVSFLDGFACQEPKYLPPSNHHIVFIIFSGRGKKMSNSLPLHYFYYSPEIFNFYAIQSAWYLHCVYAQFFIDSKKSDFWVMLAHHVITLSLLFFAFTFGLVHPFVSAFYSNVVRFPHSYFRIGMIVMFSMDVCDVFLHGAKMLRYT